jgi:hypothetical protein
MWPHPGPQYITPRRRRHTDTGTRKTTRTTKTKRTMMMKRRIMGGDAMADSGIPRSLG